MPMIIRQTTADDKIAWNQYVNQHVEASPYHNYAWVESVSEAYGHPNVSLIALNDGKVVGILPIINMKTPLSGHFLCSLPYCDVGHALADNPKITSELLTHLQQLKTSSGAKKIEYRDRAQVPENSPPTSDNLQMQKVLMLLALPESSEVLFKGFKSKLRSQIRKAEKNGLTYQLGNSSELLNAFYRILTINMRKLGSPVHSHAWFKALRKNYQDELLISIVYSEKTPVGGAIVLRNNNKASIPWASTLAEYNRLAPNMMLYWSLLKEITDTGATEFDFGRSTFGEGTFKFKKQWGAEPQLLNWFLPGEQPPLEKPGEPSQLRRIIEKTWPKLPLGLTTQLGPKIRKYISL